MDAASGLGLALVGLAMAVVAAVLTMVNTLAGRRVAVGVGALWAAWTACVMAAAASGWLQDFGAFPPRLLRLVAVTTVMGVALATRASQEGLRGLPLALPVGLQVYRLPLEIWLHQLWGAGLLPVQMTWEGANLDVVTGVTAPLVAWGVHRGRLGPRAVLLWNALGVALLFNVVGIAIRSFPGPLRTFMDEPSLARMATAPFVLVPTLMVPTAAALHGLSVRQAWRHLRTGTAPPVDR